MDVTRIEKRAYIKIAVLRGRHARECHSELVVGKGFSNMNSDLNLRVPIQHKFSYKIREIQFHRRPSVLENWKKNCQFATMQTSACNSLTPYLETVCCFLSNLLREFATSFVIVFATCKTGLRHFAKILQFYFVRKMRLPLRDNVAWNKFKLAEHRLHKN